MERPLDVAQFTSETGQSLRPKAVSSKAAGARESRIQIKNQGTVPPASSSLARKPAPPIPKKPQVLVKHSEGRSEVDSKSAIPSRSSIGRTKAQLYSSGQQKFNVIPTQKRPDHSQETPSETDGPPLPPRRAERGGRSSGGLLDEDNGEARFIPSLEPARKA